MNDQERHEQRLANIEKHKWQKGGPSPNPGGRTAGFLHFSAKLMAQMLDARVDENGKPVHKDDPNYHLATPFPVAALSLYMERVLSKSARQSETLFDFVDRLLPHLDKVDGILMHQREHDIKYLTYLVYKYCFDEQQQVLLTKKPLIVMICGRRAGKTIAIAALLILVAISHERGDVIYLGRTAKSAYDIVWKSLIDILDYLGIPFMPHIADQRIEFNTGVNIYVKGTNTKEDIENIRGKGFRLAVKDECQGDSHSKLKMLVEEVLGPTLKDYEDSRIALLGTPPRIQGSYFEEKYLEINPLIARCNWNLSVNPHIPNHEKILAKILADEFGGNENDTVYQREYLGRVGAYDTEALILRFTDANHYTDAQLAEWINSQPPSDIFLSGGIDYGFDDFDSCTITLASERKPGRYNIYEYKGNRTGTSDFVNRMKLGITQTASNPILAKINKNFTWFCDTEGLGKKITYDLASQFGITVAPAYQGQQDLLLEMLQDEVKNGWYKTRAPQTIAGKLIISEIEQEAKYMVFARNEELPGQPLTRRIDDDVYHPEILKSVLYSLRYIWLRSKAKLGNTK